MFTEGIIFSGLMITVVFIIGIALVWYKRPFSFNAAKRNLNWLLVTAVMLAAGFLVTNLMTVFAQGGTSEVHITKTFPGGATYISVDNGAPFAYEIGYSCAAITPGANCDNVTIIDDLPPEVEFVSSVPFPGANMTYDPVLHRVTVTFPDGIAPGQDGLNDGDTGILTFRVRFPPGTLGSVTADNNATIDADNATPETSGTITAETLPGTFEMTVQKSHQNTAEAGVIDVPPALVFQTIYDISVCGPDDIGGVNMLNTVVTDTLPAEAVYISAADGGSYDSVTHSVVWNPGLVTVGGCFNTSVTIGFDPNGPDGNPGGGDDPVAGNTAVNNISVTGDPEDGSPSVNLVGTDSLTLSLPSYNASVSKTSSSPSSYTGRPTEELAGGPVTYNLSLDNTGTITLTNAILTDTIPVSHTVTFINIGPSANPADGYYQTNNNPGVWSPFPGNSYTVGTTITVTTVAGTPDPNDIELVPGDYITSIRWEFGDIPVGAASGTAGFTATLDPALTPGTTLTNCADMGLQALNLTTGLMENHTGQDCADVTIIDQRSIPRPVKTGSGDYFPEEIIDYELRYTNAGVAHLPVDAPLTLADVLPAELEVVVFDPGAPNADDHGYRPVTGADTWYTFSAITNTLPAPAPTATLQTGFNGGDTLLRWQWGAPYTLAPGEELIVNFQARIKRGTPPGAVNNRAVVLWDGATTNPLVCPSGDGDLTYVDTLDVDGDSDTTETGCQTSDRTINVRAFLRMESEKFVRGARDGGIWNKDGLTVPGGDVDYRMVITNSSNVTATNLVVYDILPIVGDTGVINTIPRLSDWRPNMQGIDTNGYPVTIYYSQSANPCRPELIPSGPAGCVDDWSTTPPADFTSVQAVKLEFCDAGGTCLELAPDTGTGNGGSLDFTWDMVAPNDAPAQPARAWNSFGFTATDVGNTLTLLPAEPNKVGIRVEYNPTGVSLGNYVWFDVAGQQDDGIQQTQEIGVNGVRVELWNPGPDGTPNTADDTPYDLDSTPGVDYRITGLDGNGNPGYYLFYDLPITDTTTGLTNTYSLRFFPPAGYTTSPPNTPPDDALDSDGEFMGTDATYGDYWQTAPITFTAGITEDLTWDQGIWLPTDYGDAPYDGVNYNYPTQASLLGANPELAARHVISAGLHMGSLVDAELDGQPDADAWGDDNNGSPDDEDGVLFPAYLGTAANPSGLLTIGQNHTLVISTAVPTGETAYLTGWLDFNGDGDWDDPGEQIASDVATTGGSFNLSVNVPGTATAGTTYARFRLSPIQSVPVTGIVMGGEVEDYQVQLVPPPVKAIIATSEGHTTALNRLAVGEIVRYSLTITVPEGTMNNFQVRDSLFGGLQYLDDGTASVTFTGDVSGTVSLPFTVNGGPFGSGTDPIFDLGSVVNTDSDNNAESVVIEFNALALNNTGGAAQNDASDSRSNVFDVNYDTYSETSNTVYTYIAEPLVTLAKTVTTTPTDAGDTVVYQLTATADNANSYRTAAFDLVITDTLDASLVLQSVGVSAPGYATATDSSNIPGNQVNVGVDRLDPGDSVTVTITATVAVGASAGETIPNTGNLTWTSLPGTGTTGNPTGSNTPGGSGADDGERNGSGTNQNDYNDNASAPVTLADPQFDKLPPTPTDYTIGENVTFTLAITLPEGVTQDLIITDTLPAGLGYVSQQVVPGTFNGTLPAPTVTDPGAGNSGAVSWNFGDTTTTDDNDPNNNAFQIQVTAVVLNVMGNQDGVSLTNNAAMTYTDPESGTVTLADSENMNILEPVLNIAKSLNQPFPIAAGSTVTYTVVIQHDASSNWDAYDLVITDTLPAEFDPATLAASVTASGITAPAPGVDTGNGIVRVPSAGTFDLPQGAVVTVTITANLAAGYIPGPSIDNTAAVVWTTTDGPNPNERNGGPTGEPDGQDPLNGGALNDYEVSATAGFNQADFGDLPDGPYPTTYANSGAHHFIDGATYLGAGVDADGNGQPTNGANGDDNDANGDDEDGVAFNVPLVPGTAVDIIVTASAPGYLNAWFDWGNDGSLDAGDQVFTDQLLNAGPNTLTINVPAGINPASLYSRFRFTSGQNQATSPTGQAPNGEIEDYVLMSLGDTVWFDNGAGGGTANNGVMDGAEAGISGVTVELYRAAQIPGTDTPIATDTTDGSGRYFFYGLPPGDYVVHIPASQFGGGAPLEGLASSAGAGDANVNNNENVDENGVDEPNPPANGVSSASTTLTPGTELLDSGNSNPTIDFGFVEVDWGDLPSAAYETVLADNGARHLIDGQTFLGAGVDAEVGGQPHNAALGDDANGSPDDEDGVIFLDPLVPGRDARIQVTAGSNGYLNAWVDFNADGTMAAGDQIAADMALTPGIHIITVTVPADAAGSDTIYSRFRFTSYDPAGSVGFTGLANDGEVEDYALVSLGNLVWLDADKNGIQDGGPAEPGIDGVILNLLDNLGNAITDANGTPITTMTSGGGFYYFGGLPEDNYIVEVAGSNWNAGNVFGTGGAYEGALGSPGLGADDQNNTDDNGNNDGTVAIGLGMRSAVINLALDAEPTTDGDSNANSDLTIDFGVYTPVSIGSYVWLDANNDGAQDGETGIAGVQVSLLVDDGTGSFVAATHVDGTAVTAQTTGADGLYNFTNLPPGDYRVQVMPPAGYLPSTTQTTANDNDGENDSNIAAEPVAGTYESGTFTLISKGEPDETETYAGDNQDDAQETDGNMTVDFGFFRPVNVGNFVWIDANADGVQDGGEIGLQNATVTLLNGTGGPVTDVNGSLVGSQTTGSDGLYNFTDLYPGDYIVRVSPPPGYILSPGGADPDDNSNTDSNGYTNATNIESYPVPLTSGGEPASGIDTDGVDGNLTVDFGFYQLASIGDYVWYDRLADGDQSNDIPADGINGVTVNLYRDVDGDGVAEPGTDDGAAISTTVTADDGSGNPGYYLFSNLVPGDYFIEFVPLAGYDVSPQDAVADAQDSDANPVTGVTAVTSLVSGENDLTWDAGMYQPASIGDYVWLDANQNGIQDAGEYGVPGVTVTLYDSSNNSAGTTTTDFAGAYSFTDLPPGDYHVEVTIPVGYTAVTSADAGTDGVTNNSDINASGVMAVTTLDANENDPTWDAGIYILPASLGDYVWLDANQDGVQDAGEYGISGVTVNLYDGGGNLLDTTTTDAHGGYNFTNLPPGDYFVEMVPPAGYTITQQDSAAATDATDSDIDQVTGRTITTTLSSGENDPTWDGGLYIQPASIGDTIWLDADQDGVQDGNEYGIENVTVQLYDSGDNLIGTTTTDATGFYQFVNLPPGDYYVEVTPPAGYTITQQDSAAATDATDSDIDQTTGRTITTTLSSGEDAPTWDGGLYIQPAVLGNYVWLDANQDGIQDANENGVQNVTVNLYSGSGTLLNTMQTNVFGGYGFDNLPPGDYVVEIVPPAAYTVTLQNQGGDTALDSDIDPDPISPTYGRTTTITLAAGQTDLTWDGGLFAQAAAIGDLVWLDANGNGLQDGGENGISGVTVNLYDSATNTVLLTTTTNITGAYLFENLPAGDYYVTVTPPAGYAISPQDQGGDDTLDSDIDATGRMISTTLAANEQQLQWDAGLYQPVSLGNRVWFDANGDGVQDAGEADIQGVELALFQSDGLTQAVDANGSPVANVFTDASGFYNFTNLPPGDYVVEVVAGNWNAGNVFGSGGAYAGAVGSPGVGGDNQDNTDDNGTVNGTAVLSGVQSTVITLTSNGEPTAEDLQEATPDNNSDLTIDFGFYQPVSLGNRVWLDDNADGVQDAGELDIQGVELALFQGDGVTPAVDVDGNAVANATTDASGYYNFTNLPPGDYVVEVVAANWNAGNVFGAGGLYDGAVGSPGSGADDQNNVDDNGDNDGLAGTARSGVITLTSNGEPTAEDAQETTPDNNSDLTVDFGFYQKASLGNYVWLDQPVNGVQDDPAVNGMNGVTVNLYDGSGTMISSTVTADDGSGNPGYYLFDNLTPGDYSVEFISPAGYAITLQDDAAATDTTDSDADQTTGRTITTTLTSGEADMTWDAGLYQYAAIGDYVWLDSNADGIQDLGESGINGVTVVLSGTYGLSGTVLMTTTTNASGYYTFPQLIPGDYALTFYPPTGYAISPQDQGSDDAADSDIDPSTGMTVVTTLDPGEIDPTWDAGVFSINPAIDIEKSVSIARVTPNQTSSVTYTLQVTNTGNLTLTNVDITDTLPVGMSYVTNTASITPTMVVGQDISWNDVTNGLPFAPGATTTITFAVSFDSQNIGTYVNNAGVVGTYPPGNNYPGGQVNDQDDASVVIEDPSVALDKEVVAPGIVDNVITYTIRITNTGPSIIDVLPLVDTFVGPIEYVGGSPAADTVDNANGSLVWNDLTTTFGDVLPGQSIVIETAFRLTTTAYEVTLENTAQVVNAIDTFTNPTNEPQDTVTLVNVPTAVTLSSFTAEWADGNNVLVRWTTESELDNAFFQIYRSQTNDVDTAELVTTVNTQVPGGSGPGTTYEYLDAVPGHAVWYYWLVDVDSNGVETVHGPASVAASVTNTYTVFLPVVIRP